MKKTGRVRKASHIPHAHPAFAKDAVHILYALVCSSVFLNKEFQERMLSVINKLAWSLI